MNSFGVPCSWTGKTWYDNIIKTRIAYSDCVGFRVVTDDDSDLRGLKALQSLCADRAGRSLYLVLIKR